MSKIPHVTWLRAFDVAARHSSFSSAATELGLTPAAVSQQIKLLEQHLGAQLFKRLPRGVVLTDLGHAYAQPIRKSFAEMQDATTGLFGAHRKHRVRVHGSISYTALILAPRLSEFHAAHPDIDVQITTAVWTERVEDHTVDVEIRYGHGDWEESHIRHLGHQVAEVVCHPDFAAKFGTGIAFQDLAPHAIPIIGSEADWGKMAEHLGTQAPSTASSIKADSSLIALQILAGGVGAGLISCDFTKRYLEQGQLISPLEFRLPLPRSFFLVTPDSAPARPEVTQFCDWLYDMHHEAI